MTIRRRNADPEHALQVAVVEYLKFCLPPDVLFTANAAGVRVHIKTAMKMKAAGVKRGWPDLQFLDVKTGTVYFIELKPLKSGTLSVEQREFLAACAPFNIAACCRSVEQVRDTLIGWGVQMRDRPVGVLVHQLPE